MKLSDGEKLIAYMLADLMKSLEVQTELNLDLVQDAIAGDDLWALKWEYGSIFHSGGPSDDVVEETAEIMTMCRVLENSIQHLPKDQQAQIPEDDRTIFIGFDGNHEPHFGVATVLIEKLGRYQEWQETYLNSHSESLDRYRSMKRVYDTIEHRPRGLLSLEDVQRVLAAGSQ